VRKVEVLASFLRVADGLDHNHDSVVQSLNFKIGSKKVTVQCVSTTKSVLVKKAFNKKKDLFEKVFDRKMVLEWKQR
jgi:hypothetical protein